MFVSTLDRFLAQNEEQIQKGLEDVGKMLKSEIQSAAPVKTGTLRDSVDYEVEPRLLRIGSDVHYAPFVELGTIYMKANPFMRRTIYSKTSEMISIMKDNLTTR